MNAATQEGRVENYDALLKIGEAITYILLGGSAYAAKKKLEGRITAAPPREASEAGSHPVDLLNAKMDHMLECVTRSEGKADRMEYEIGVLTRGYRKLTGQVEELQRANRADSQTGESTAN